MKKKNYKLMTMDKAIEKFVFDGAHISIGGFTINRNPMAAVYEIIRQKKKNLHLYAHSNGHGVDELIGGGCVSRLEIAYSGNGRFAPTCIRFRKAVEKGLIRVEDYSNYQMTLRFMAGAMGVPFLPCRSGLETDIVNRWGFSESLRISDPKIPDMKLIVIKNPFGQWGHISKVVLVPAINPDITIIHVHKSDPSGLCRIHGLPFADIEQAKAARTLIVTCEQIVDTEDLKSNPDANCLPSFCVDAVVHAPFGAYPTACFYHYDYDPVFLNNYKKQAGDDKTHKKYLKEWIFDTENHEKMLAMIDPDQLASIKADEHTGYAVKLDRR